MSVEGPRMTCSLMSAVPGNASTVCSAQSSAALTLGTFVDQDDVGAHEYSFYLERVGRGEGADGEHDQGDDAGTPDGLAHVVAEFDLGQPDEQQE